MIGSTCPGRGAARSAAPQSRDPCRLDGPRISSAPRRKRGALRSIRGTEFEFVIARSAATKQSILSCCGGDGLLRGACIRATRWLAMTGGVRPGLRRHARACPGIHVLSFLVRNKDVGGRDKLGHDEERLVVLIRGVGVACSATFPFSQRWITLAAAKQRHGL